MIEVRKEGELLKSRREKLPDRQKDLLDAIMNRKPDLETVRRTMSLACNSFCPPANDFVMAAEEDPTARRNLEYIANDVLFWYASARKWVDPRNEYSYRTVRRIYANNLLKQPSKFELLGPLFRDEHPTVMQAIAEFLFCVLDKQSEKNRRRFAALFPDRSTWYCCPMI